METLERIYCADCGNIIEEGGEEYYNDNDDRICRSCNKDYTDCDRCGDTMYYDDVILIDGGRLVVCEHCANTHYWQCEDCGEYVSERRLWHTGNITLCDWCADNYYVCYECGDVVHIDNIHVINNGYYCEYCAQYHVIYDCDYKPLPFFYGCDNGKRVGYGVELEIDYGEDRNNAVRDIYHVGRDHIYLKDDGSLSSKGFEIVTHPATLDYHMKKFPWDDILNMAREYEYESHDTNTCGLHIHASRGLFGHDRTLQDLNIAKCILLIDAYWNEYIVPFSRRNYSKLDQWARKPDAGISTSDDNYTAIDKAKKSINKGRYLAVNLRNYNTVEFRFFRGTLRRDTIIASIQFLDTLINYAKKTELKDIFNKSFLKVFGITEYSELNEYLKLRNIIKGAK